jgi:hypothetical protein
LVNIPRRRLAWGVARRGLNRGSDHEYDQQVEGVRVILILECASRQIIIATTIGVAGIWLSVLEITDDIGRSSSKFAAGLNIHTIGFLT